MVILSYGVQCFFLLGLDFLCVESERLTVRSGDVDAVDIVTADAT
jgi:hypothetical protein